VVCAYLDNPVAHRAVRLVADGIGGAPLCQTDPALAALVTATSAGQPLLETLASQMLLHGNAYVQVLKDANGWPVELFALRPERVTLIPGPRGWPTGITYRVGEQVLNIPMEDEDASPNIIHIRDYHPADDHYGLPPPPIRPWPRIMPPPRGTARCWRMPRGLRARWSMMRQRGGFPPTSSTGCARS
jgi:phage portal protein BeeE